MTKNKRIVAAATIATLIAIPAEGLRQYAYYDPPGILTVCYGSTTNVEKGKKYSLDECRSRLDKDMMEAIQAVERCHPELPVNVLAAFGDAAYNLGPRVACKSTASRMLAEKNFRGACEQLLRWDKAVVGGVSVALPGLTKRRKFERDICVEGL